MITNRPKTQVEIYDSCLTSGYLSYSDSPQIELAQALYKNSALLLESSEKLSKALGKEDPAWMSVFLSQYDSLLMNARALLALKNITSQSDLCILSALCQNYPSLELSFDVLESFRSKADSSRLHGKIITPKDYKDLSLQLRLYLMTLSREVQSKLSSP